MKIGSLFSGIGGFDLAARWMGWETVWYSEIDPYACKVMGRHFPESRNVGDITTWRPTGDDVVDLVCGGFPCQPVSLAGKGLAQEDDRWLWPHFARVVCVLRPRYVVVENVPGLRSRGMGDVLGDLAESGYDAEWESIPASAVGAPHQRDRVFLVAYADHQRQSQPQRGVSDERGRAGDGCFEASAYTRGRRLPEGVFGCRNPRTIKPAAYRRTSLGTHVGSAWETEPEEGWLDDGVSGGLAGVYSALWGNAIVPQCAYEIFKMIDAHD